jgi:hypothetical protein
VRLAKTISRSRQKPLEPSSALVPRAFKSVIIRESQKSSVNLSRPYLHRKFGMSNDRILESGNLSSTLQAISTTVHDAVESYQGDSMALLALLRQLEQLHREIRDGSFQDSLPENRQQLYSLLKDIESEGGWPYIERMRLKAFLAQLAQEANE